MTDAPALSIIIPTLGRADTLRLTLRAFDHQETQAPFEIVVCDDGSTDATGTVISRAVATGRVPVVHLRQENAGANAARNRAIAAARGARLLIVNDDTIPTPGLVAAHLAAHARRGGRETAILGRMTIDPALPFSAFSALHHDASYDALAGRVEVGWDAFLTCNVSVDRAFLEAAGGFDPALTWHEDIELGERLARRGMRLFYEAGRTRLPPSPPRRGRAISGSPSARARPWCCGTASAPISARTSPGSASSGPPPSRRRPGTGSPTSPCRRRSCPAGRRRRAR